MIRWGRIRKIVAGYVAVLALGGIASPPAAATVPPCAGSARVFAVDAGTGHLVQIQSCPGETPSLGATAEVDTADWRVYSKIFGMYDHNAVILYAVSATGELWWRRQNAPGAALSRPVRVAASIDWRHDVVFAGAPGYLELGDFHGPVRTLRHTGWTTGGTGVSEMGNLFRMFEGPDIIAVTQDGYAIGIERGMAFGVWRDPSSSGTRYDDVWLATGRLPDLQSFARDRQTLLGVVPGGDVLQFLPGDCAGRPGKLTGQVSGHFSSVLVPVDGDATRPPQIRPIDAISSGHSFPRCSPWEWQE
ncbi:hypothetical protein [Actinocrispum wychmicini]|uniref:Tachylectin n=1 Tax=Actinocrispum wychmicini TaxID=1213861 RepID=A0A4R2IMT1_9PSEU|nr:hypothetical protein [Actinocrispum wychmicini]TCO45299.1 hypothetical protein EV192_12163 [Actinocrispum wychmicini]